MTEKKSQEETVKTLDQAINETEMAVIKILEDSGLNVTILELIVRNIHLQLQNLALNARQQAEKETS